MFIVPLHAPVVPLAHATLVASEPAAGTRLAGRPERLRLVFSEPVEAGMSQVAIALVGGRPTRITMAGDPRDVHALVAPVRLPADGAYRVDWHIVSADGHPVEGSFTFVVGSAPLPVDTGRGAPAPRVTWGPTMVGAPAVPAVLRGLGVGCVMAVFGMLAFARSGDNGTSRVLDRLALTGAILLVAHLAAWLVNGAPDHRLDAAWLGAASGTLPGQIELWRSGLGVGIAWALVLARRARVALVFAFATLVASAAVGHSAAFDPVWAIPAKAVHLLAGGVWLGGLAWLALQARLDPERLVADAARVSRAALVAVIAVALSGLVQTLLIVPWPLEGLRSAYGSVIVAKVAGLGVLVVFGAYHRTVALPRLAAGATEPIISGLRRSLMREIGVFAVVILLGGLVAYIAPPTEATARPAISHEQPE